jgi:hypothetical protein
MSDRNSGVKGEMEAAVSFRLVANRLPDVVFIAW